MCFRGDGSFAHMEGLAMVFQSEVTEQDEGQYICRASFYHHKAKVEILVEVMSEEKLFGGCLTAFSVYIQKAQWHNYSRNSDHVNMLK